MGNLPIVMQETAIIEDLLFCMEVKQIIMLIMSIELVIQFFSIHIFFFDIKVEICIVITV